MSVGGRTKLRVLMHVINECEVPMKGESRTTDVPGFKRKLEGK